MPNSITFHCETISPLFMTGADATKPELRAPSIKGAMRFWWRAMNGHLDLKILREKEGDIFGNTSQRSKINIQVIEEPEAFNRQEFLLPHRKSSPSTAFKVGEPCEIKLSMGREVNGFTIKHLENLFIVTCFLSGFGKRSRRGFGSLAIKQPLVNVAYPQLITSLNYLNNQFYMGKDQKGNECILSKFKNAEKYPFIKQIQIGRPQSILTTKIGDVTHNLKQRDFQVYEPSLGHATRGRFASPVYVSTMRNQQGQTCPIITTLNTVPDRDFYKVSLSLQEEFKNLIL